MHPQLSAQEAKFISQQELKKSPEQVAASIEALLQILLPTEAPNAEQPLKYAEAYVDLAYIVIMHGATICKALREIKG